MSGNIPLGVMSTQIDGSFYGDLVALGLTGNLKLCSDAGAIDSYDGSSQSWLDLAGGGYDFFRGADGDPDTDDPTFNGTPGGLSSSEYWSFGADDFFRYDSANETWMDNLHKNNALFTAMFWVNFADFTTTAQGFMGDHEGLGSRNGIDLSVTGTDGYLQARVNVSPSTTVLAQISTLACSTSTWQLVGFSIDEAAGTDGSDFFLDGTVDPFTGTYNNPTAGGSTDIMEIGAAGNAGLRFHNGSLMAGAMVWEGVALTEAQMNTIWNRQKGRFGL